MTLPRFGKIVPIQGFVLELAGSVPSRDRRAEVVSESEEERLRIIRRGRAALVERTGRDFGYDLEGWVEALETGEGYRSELRHPHAYRTTISWGREAIASPDRRRLVSLIARADGAPSGEGVTEGGTR